MKYYLSWIPIFVFIVGNSIVAQEPDKPPPPPMVINETVRGHTAEDDTYAVTLEEGQTVLLILDRIFDACLTVIDPHGETIVADRDVEEYTYSVVIPFIAQETGTYQLQIGDFRCDPMTQDLPFRLTVFDGDFPVLNADPVSLTARQVEQLLLADVEDGTRYRLTVQAEDDLPQYRTLALVVDETPNEGLDEYTLSLQEAQYAEHLFEASHTGRIFIIVTYRLPNPAVTEGLNSIDITLKLEEVSE